MKKFGTPIGAAPGCASVKPEVDTVGPGSASAFCAAFLAWPPTVDTRSPVAFPPFKEGLCVLVCCEAEPPALGVDEPDDPPEEPPDPEEPDEPPDPGVGGSVGTGVGAWTPTPGVAVGAGVISWTETTGAERPGKVIWSAGV